MSLVTDLKERREAVQLADLEFYRVKRMKLCRERAKHDCPSDEELPRDATNRASAAASRAKLVFLARDLENRTDRLEYERNLSEERSMRMAKTLKDLQNDRKNVQSILRTLWERKDPTVCAIFLESNIMNVLAAAEDDVCDVADSYLMAPIRVSIPRIRVSGTRRSPAVDNTGLPPSSPLGSTTKILKLPNHQFPTMLPLQRSPYDTHPRARNLTSSPELQSFLDRNKGEEHSLERFSSTQFKCRTKTTRHLRQQIRASLGVEHRVTRTAVPKLWYDAVRDKVRT